MREWLQAWGHPTLPDLDITGDDISVAIEHAKRNYPYISIGVLEPISLEAIDAYLTSCDRN